MCEWLTLGEWSDVQLLCGGRSFSAHRAVLASVSTFLRRILLTSPDEAITFIVLPDFDLEAMSSVLYYIYNGEVVLQNNKLGLFLEIIHAMQIYVDSQYLTEIFTKIQDIEEKYIELANNCENISLPSQIFTLGLNVDNEQMFHIKKCKETQRPLVKYSQSNFDFQDSNVRYLNESEVDESRLGNLKSPYEDRQRNTLLRDLFIETYPRNGNVNGLTESVLAISNECYQSPASELLPNANSKHLSIGGARAARPKTPSCHSLHSPAVLGIDRLQRTYNSNLECSKPIDATDFPTNRYSTELQNAFRFHSGPKTFLDESRRTFDDIVQTTPGIDVNKLVLDQIKYRINTDFLIQNNLPIENKRLHKKGNTKSIASSKVIFNQVLESPWNARQPNNFRPFRKKEKHAALILTNKDQTIETQNDTNNNVEVPAPVPEGELTKRELEQPLQSFVTSPPVIENREFFKCTNCDQVFTSSESLSTHMRRHSTSARYACGDCGKTFSQLRNFKYHMSIHRGTREFAATCTVCGKYFNDRGYLSSHMKIHRNRKEYKCSLCPKSFNQRVAYNMHVRIHTGVKPHVCEECGKAFSRKMLLKQHQRTHSGERPYSCPHCDKCFADRSNMTLHVRLHTGVKPFSCPMCPKSFTKKHHLKSHLNFHTGSKPYNCPRCHLAFTQSSNMRTHYKKCNTEPSTSESLPK